MTSAEPGRVAVIRSGDRPRINTRLPELIRAEFSDHEVDDVDVFGSLRANRTASLANMARSGWQYRGDLLRRRVRPKRAYVASSSFSRHVTKTVADQISPTTHRFTIQSQSLWNAAHPEVPHFIYTDHTRRNGMALQEGDPHGGTGAEFLEREQRIYDDARAIFVRSRHVADMLEHGYGCDPAKVEVVGVGPNGDVPTSDPVGSANRRRLLFVGVDWERKGGPLLIEAFLALATEFSGLELEVVGCEPDVTGIDGVTVHGRLPLDEVYELQRGCDIFCLPTLFEPFGVAFIEAMHAGLPVVGPDAGAVPDFIKNGVTGEMHERGDAVSLASALRSLLAAPDRAMEMGQAGRELARDRYAWPAVMERMRARIEMEVSP